MVNVETPSTNLNPSIFENYLLKPLQIRFLAELLYCALATYLSKITYQIILLKSEVVIVLYEGFQKWTDIDRWTEFQRLPYLYHSVLY